MCSNLHLHRIVAVWQNVVPATVSSPIKKGTSGGSRTAIHMTLCRNAL